MKKLFVGDTGEYLSILAKKFNKNAKLITAKNYQDILNTQGTFYTSLGDFSNPSDFCSVLMSTSDITFAPPLRWSDTGQYQDPRFTLESETKAHLYQWAYIKKKSVENLNFDFVDIQIPNFDIVKRETTESQIWNIGCSITKGVGVLPHQRYGELIAKNLQLPVTILAYEGSSIDWAGDQLLLADVLPGDTVIWGITSINRYSYFLQQDRMYHVTYQFHKNYPLSHQLVSEDWLNSPNNAFYSMQKIAQIQNFCQKNRLKLIMLGMFTHDYMSRLQCLNNFADCNPTTWIDFGSDNQHPGPKTHQKFAKIALDLLHDV